MLSGVYQESPGDLKRWPTILQHQGHSVHLIHVRHYLWYKEGCSQGNPNAVDCRVCSLPAACWDLSAQKSKGKDHLAVSAYKGRLAEAKPPAGNWQHRIKENQNTERCSKKGSFG
eukprot:1159897-Pelagomonas_calceolata.AAC.9